MIDVGFGLAEEVAINAMEGNALSKETIYDTSVSVGVDSISSLSSNESRLTKETMQEFSEAIPKTFRGNHPKVKAPAKKIVRRVGRKAARESTEAITEKTVGNIFKNILKAIF